MIDVGRHHNEEERERTQASLHHLVDTGDRKTLSCSYKKDQR